MTDTDPNWYIFTCNNCGWSTKGTFNFYNEERLRGATPDTDCPSCGFHDAVVDRESCEEPDDIAAVVKHIHTGPYAF